jgi:metallopeptidase MepB
MIQLEEAGMDPPPLMFKVTPDSLLSRAQKAVTKLKSLEDEIVQSIPIHTATFANVLLPIAHCENRFKATYLYTDLLRANSPDPDIRNGAKKAIEIMDSATLQSSTREDLFVLVDAAWNRGEILDPESQRLLDNRRRKYILNGFGLSTEKRERLKVINQRLLDLRIAFGQNLVEDTSYMWLSREDFAGVSENTLKRLSEIRKAANCV